MSKSIPDSSDVAAAAKPAATLIVMRERAGTVPELLMVERSSRMAFAAGAMVFPGGRVDDADFDFAKVLGWTDLDDGAARIAAIRETIEEAGIPVGLIGTVTAEVMTEVRRQLHAGEALAAICERHGWRLELDALLPYTRWRPPILHSRTFDTRFYIVREPDSGIEATVDAVENRRLCWTSAQAVLDDAAADKAKIIFPTARNLERLAQYNSFSDVTDDVQRYPSRLITTFIEEREDGRYLCIPPDLGYPVLAERLENALRE